MNKDKAYESVLAQLLDSRDKPHEVAVSRLTGESLSRPTGHKAEKAREANRRFRERIALRRANFAKTVPAPVPDGNTAA
jgi:hypothetical protein